MNIETDYNILLKKFDETRTELNVAENSFRILQPHLRRDDTNIKIWYGKHSGFSSFRYIPEKFAHKTPPKLSESSEESAYEDELNRKKVCLKSAVTLRVRKSESRKDVIYKQNINQRVRTRNSRILGMLQSTLRKFQDDAVKRQPQDLKKKLIELKVEAAKEEENQRMKMEKKELFFKIKEKRLELDCLKQMIGTAKSFEIWKDHNKKLLGFIITKAKPRICYLPVSHTPSSMKQLEKSRTEVQENIQKQAAALKKELAEIQDSYLATYSSNAEEKQIESYNSRF